VAEDWGGRYVEFLKDQEGFRSQPYEDATGNLTVGYGHKIREGEDFSSGISQEDADRLLRQDMQSHYRRTRARFGEQDFDSLGERERLMLLDMDFNAGLHKFPKFREAVRQGDVQTMLAEYERSADGKPLTRRNEGFYDLFLRELDSHEMEVVSDDTPSRSVALRPTGGGSGVKTYVDSQEFLTLPEEERVGELAKRDERFAAIAATDPARAKELADSIASFHKGGGYGALDSLSGGLETGLGQAALVAAGTLQMIEDAGIAEDLPDEDLLSWANQRIIDGNNRVGTGWQSQVAHITGNLAGAIVPGALLSGAAYLGGAAAGIGGMPLLVGSQALGMGAAGAAAGYTESPEEALKRGSIDFALGGFGGYTAKFGRLLRFPMDAAAGLAAGEIQGLETRENIVQALAMATIAGVPGKYAPPAKMKAAGIEPDSFPGAAAALAEAEKLQRLRAMVGEMDAPLEAPVRGPDGQELRTVGEFLRAVGDDIEGTPVVHWRPQDMTPEQVQAWTNREALALDDARLIQTEQGGPKAELPGGWNPGWRHVPNKPYGAQVDRVVAGSAVEIKKPGEIIAPLAKAFGFTVRRGEVKGGEGALGWSWGKNREMKVLKRGDVQTAAHEWAHDLVWTRPELARYAQGKELANEVVDLRNWLAQKEADAGIPFAEQGVPVQTLLKYADQLPDRFKRLEEQMALSYDRPDLHEGLAEFVRVYSTNNKKFGGDTVMDGPDGIAPEMTKIWEDFVENTMSKPEREAYEQFVREAHDYVQADALTASQARIGGDDSTESILQSRMSRFRQGAIDSNEGAWNAVAQSVSPDQADRVIAYFQAAQNSNRLLDLAARRGVPKLEFDAEGRPQQVAQPDALNLEKILNDIGGTPEMVNAFGKFAIGPRAAELHGQAIKGSKISSVDEVTKDYIDALAKRRAKTKDPAEAAEIDNFLGQWHSGQNRMKMEDIILKRTGHSRRENLFSPEEINAMLQVADDPRYAHFPKVYEDLKRWQRQVRNYGERAGLFSRKQVLDWERHNAEYAFPFQRDMSDVIGGAAPGDSVLRGKVVRQLQGSDRNLAGNWLELTLGGADTIFRRAEENLAKQQLVDTILKSKNAGIWFDTYAQFRSSRAHPGEAFERRVGDIVDPKDRDRTIVVRREGKEYYYTPKDQGMLDSVKWLRRPALPTAIRAIGKGRTFVQDSITLNPEFFVSAMERDLVGGFLFSKTGGNILRKAINGIYHSARNTPEYQNYMANVGATAQLTGVRSANADVLLADARRAASNVRSILSSPAQVINLMRKITNAIESGVRFGEYQQALKQGIPAKHAAWLGTQIQPNFSARGTWAAMRGVQEVTPFLSATMNAADRFARAMFRDAEGRGAFMARLGATSLAAVTLTELNRRLDPDWGKHPEWLKRAYHIIPVPIVENGQLQTDENGNLALERYLIAKNHELGLIANVAERVMDEMYNSTADGVADAATDVAMILLSNVGVNAGEEALPIPLPFGIGLGAELQYNVNSFTGNPIEPLETTGRSAHLRATSKTPEIYRKWGEWMGQVPFAPEWMQSPAKAEHIVRYFTNSFGVQGAMLAEQFLNPMGPDIHGEDLPIVRRHRLRDEKYDRAVGEFWDINQQLTELMGDIDYLRDTGDREGLQRMREDPKFRQEFAMAKAFQKARAIVSDLGNMQDKVREHPTMPGDEKLRRLDEIEQKKRQIQRRMFETYRERME